VNERIQSLADEARISNYLSTYGPEFKYAFEKFAELLVLECAAEADKQTIYCRGIPWGRWIKEHFGLQT